MVNVSTKSSKVFLDSSESDSWRATLKVMPRGVVELATVDVCACSVFVRGFSSVLFYTLKMGHYDCHILRLHFSVVMSLYSERG